MIEGLFQTGAMPALERVVQFTAQRHRLIADNVANVSTPNFRPADLDPAEFQHALGRAIDARRERGGPFRGDLPLRDTANLRFTRHGIDVDQAFRDENVLFHDRNNRSVERLMQDLAENAMMHNSAIRMLGNQFSMLESAIQERP